MLRAFGLALHDGIARKMRDAHRAVGAVDMLPTGTRGAVGIDAEVFFVDFNMDVVVDDREYPDGGKARMPAGI